MDYIKSSHSLHDAYECRDIQLLRLLLQQGDTDCCDHQGHTVLNKACREGRAAVVFLLLLHDTQRDEPDILDDELACAVETENDLVLELLLRFTSASNKVRTFLTAFDTNRANHPLLT